MDNFILQQWIDNLRGLSSELKALNGSTERDFISIGSRLGELSGQSNEVTTLGTSAVSLVGGTEAEENTKALQKILDHMDQYFNKIHTNLDNVSKALQTTLDVLDSVQNHLVSFRKIVKQLKMLGVSTKIESARLTENENGFYVIAEHIERLSEIVDFKSTNILKGLNNLRKDITQTLSRLLALRTTDHTRTNTVLDNIVSSLSSLAGMYSSSTVTLGHIKHRSEVIFNDISNIVVSLQFHDITRQQVEHVQDNLDNLVEKLTLVLNSNGTQEFADKMKVICAFMDVSLLQITQLSNAKQELTAALTTVIGDLEEISNELTDLSGMIVKLLSTTGGGDSSFLSDILRDVSAVASFLKENAKGNSELSTDVTTVAQTVGDISAFVSEIDDIGAEIELVALNALVKSAHTGTVGMALGVLAEAIRDLSENTLKQTNSLTCELKDISNATEDLQTDSIHTMEESIAQIEQMMTEMDALIKSFTASNEYIIPALNRINGKVRSFKKDVEKVVWGVTAHRNAEKTLDHVMAELNRMVVEAQKVVPKEFRLEKGLHLASLADGYTMEKERLLHKKHMKMVAGESDATDTADQNLGDNIELF